MPAAHESPQSACRTLGCWALLFLCRTVSAQPASEVSALPFSGPGRVQGANTCSSAMCHGGATEQTRQYVWWSQRDVHARGFATLGTARAARMAEALRIVDPTTSPRCTACHAPLASIPPQQLSPGARVSEGVSCVCCHGPADTWLRSHTRSDYTHAQRVAAGMRDLRDLRLRAGACVACHQNIEPDLIHTGRHPALLFELDGQAHAEPKHWRESPKFDGAQAWFVGQAVAWREVTWALLHGGGNDEHVDVQWRALRWLLQRAGYEDDSRIAGQLADQPSRATLGTALQTADDLATRASHGWSPDVTYRLLVRLAGTAEDFRTASESTRGQAARAERLVLALDRLLAALPLERRAPDASACVDRLFALAQSAPDFAPADFARELAELERTLGSHTPNK